MEPVRIYTANTHKETLEILAKNGFAPLKHRKFLLAYPTEPNLFWDVHDWHCSNTNQGFMVFPEQVYTPAQDDHEDGLANNFSYSDIVQYHKAFKELPQTVITAADEDIGLFLKLMPPLVNPFFNAIRTMDSVLIIRGKDEVYRETELPRFRKYSTTDLKSLQKV